MSHPDAKGDQVGQAAPVFGTAVLVGSDVPAVLWVPCDHTHGDLLLPGTEVRQTGLELPSSSFQHFL